MGGRLVTCCSEVERTKSYVDAFAKLEAADPGAIAAFAAHLGRQPEDQLTSLHLKRLLNGVTSRRWTDARRTSKRAGAQYRFDERVFRLRGDQQPVDEKTKIEGLLLPLSQLSPGGLDGRSRRTRRAAFAEDINRDTLPLRKSCPGSSLPQTQSLLSIPEEPGRCR